MKKTSISIFIEITKTLKKEKEGSGPKWPRSAQQHEQAWPSAACPGTARRFLQKGPCALEKLNRRTYALLGSRVFFGSMPLQFSVF
jgi:hypothetical protein